MKVILTDEIRGLGARGDIVTVKDGYARNFLFPSGAAAIADAGLSASDIAYTATTGLGRYGFKARDIQITDITSGARGAHFLFPQSPVVLDIGANIGVFTRVALTAFPGIVPQWQQIVVFVSIASISTRPSLT